MGEVERVQKNIMHFFKWSLKISRSVWNRNNFDFFSEKFHVKVISVMNELNKGSKKILHNFSGSLFGRTVLPNNTLFGRTVPHTIWRNT